MHLSTTPSFPLSPSLPPSITDHNSPHNLLPLQILLFLHASLHHSTAQSGSGDSTSTRRLNGRLQEFGQNTGIDTATGLAINLGDERRFKLDLDDGETSLTLVVRPGSVWTNTSSLVMLFDKNAEDVPPFTVDNACILTGRVESREDSVVSIDICQGITGIIQIGRLDYHIKSKGVLERVLNKNRSFDLNVRVVENEDIEILTDGYLIPEIRAQRQNILSVSNNTIVSGTIEVGLFLDKSFMIFMKRLGFKSPTKIANYLVTKWNIVNTIYSNADKVGSDVTIKVKYIEMWRKKNPVWYKANQYEDLGKNLLDFCVNSKRHVLDHKVLYTRGANNGVMGVAYVGGVCDKMSKCSVVRINPNRLYAASIEMHELGHSLGFKHTREMEGCGRKPGFMSTGLTSLELSYNFSPCFKSVLRKTIRSKRCLRKENVRRRIG